MEYNAIVRQIEEWEDFKVGQRVRFKQPNLDKSVHTIISMGVDSDGDVWVKLDDGKAPFFDWRDILDYANIPQGFIEIDNNPLHWVMTGVSGPNEGRRFPDPDLFCVPSIGLHGDMTEAMMSAIPGWDDTVEPLKLEDKRGYKFCMAFLMQDGNLDVPGGRYGANTRQCAEVAILMALVMQYHNGEPLSYYSLNSDMERVVNSADSVAELLSEFGYVLEDYDIDVKVVLGDEYEPQTALERLSKWAEVDIENGDTLTLTLSDDDADKLLADIRANEPPFGTIE